MGNKVVKLNESAKCCMVGETDILILQISLVRSVLLVTKRKRDLWVTVDSSTKMETRSLRVVEKRQVLY